MQRREFTIINKLGLHARAAAKLVTLASGFASDIEIRHGVRNVNGKSIMGVMMLAASQGKQIEVTASGADEVQALDALQALIQDRFGEPE